MQTSAFVILLSFCTLGERKCFDFPAYANTKTVGCHFTDDTQEMNKQILDFNLQTINWFQDKIVDWANAGTLLLCSQDFRPDFI